MAGFDDAPDANSAPQTTRDRDDDYEKAVAYAAERTQRYGSGLTGNDAAWGDRVAVTRKTTPSWHCEVGINVVEGTIGVHAMVLTVEQLRELIDKLYKLGDIAFAPK